MARSLVCGTFGAPWVEVSLLRGSEARGLLEGIKEVFGEEEPVVGKKSGSAWLGKRVQPPHSMPEERSQRGSGEYFASA